MKIRSVDTVLMEIRERLKVALPQVITELNNERADFELRQIDPQFFVLNVVEGLNAQEFLLLLGTLADTKNAGRIMVESLMLDVFVGFMPENYATPEQAMCASYRYQAALKVAFQRINLPYGEIRYVGAEPPGSMRVENKALYGAMLQYDIQLH